MAALLEDTLLTAAPLKSGDTQAPPADPLVQSLYGDSAQPFTQADIARNPTRGDAIKSVMPELVKGAGFARKGGNAPLTDQNDITLRAVQATTDLRNAVWQGYNRKADVVNKGFDQGFLNQFGALRTALSTPSIGEQIAQIFSAMPGGADALKSFTAGNLGIGSVYGFVPFDLLAPSRLIYPVYTLN